MKTLIANTADVAAHQHPVQGGSETGGPRGRGWRSVGGVTGVCESLTVLRIPYFVVRRSAYKAAMYFCRHPTRRQSAYRYRHHVRLSARHARGQGSGHAQQDPAPLSQAALEQALAPTVRSLISTTRLPGTYLHHRSAVGEFSLSSDAVIPTFKWASHIKELIPEEELEAFNRRRVHDRRDDGVSRQSRSTKSGRSTRRAAVQQRIGDRFDLTLECIRRHYSEGESPLSGVLARYARFFDLFEDFRGYVEFFLLQDLVSNRLLCGEDLGAVRRLQGVADSHRCARVQRVQATPRSHSSRRETGGFWTLPDVRGLPPTARRVSAWQHQAKVHPKGVA